MDKNENESHDGRGRGYGDGKIGADKMQKLTHLSLFSGIGGLELAAEMAGFRTVGQCEWADYPTKVLEKHWPDVPRWRDIRTLTGESFYEKTGIRTVDVISGGFPCQPFSVAGKRRGKEDDRYLWPEMLRVISELRPTWVFGENVAGIVNMALDQVYADLENEGYTVQALIIPACAVDAPHRRDRCAILAYANCRRYIHREIEKHSAETREYAQRKLGGCGEDVAHAESVGQQRVGGCWNEGGGARSEEAQFEGRCDVLSNSNQETGGCWANHRGGAQEHVTGERRSAQPGLGGVATRIPYRLDGGINYDHEKETRPGKGLPNLRECDNEETVRETAGRFRGIQEEKILQPSMYGKSAVQSRISGTICGKKTEQAIPETSVRDLRNRGESSSASQGHESIQQQQREHYDAMCEMPHKIALGYGKENAEAERINAWLDRGMSAPGYWMPEPDIPRLTTKREHRKDRLQCLGNAVVPQQFYPVFRAIAESERLEALYE